MEVSGIQMERSSLEEEGVRAMIATLRTKKRGDHAALMEKIRGIAGVVHLEEL